MRTHASTLSLHNLLHMQHPHRGTTTPLCTPPVTCRSSPGLTRGLSSTATAEYVLSCEASRNDEPELTCDAAAGEEAGNGWGWIAW
jgi:hypothetical protein